MPDAAGEAAARRILELVKGLTADDLVLCLISGGGSSLLPLALPGLTLADKQALNRALLASGASIGEMNCVRRHLSAIKGGRLAAACHPARVVNLLLSDVPGDDPIDIASGPTVADPTTCADALGHPAPLRDRRAAARPRSARKRRRRNPQARRSAPARDRNPLHRHAADGARGGGRGGPRCRPDAVHPRRRHRRRGARRRQDDGRHRPAGGAARAARCSALRAPVRAARPRSPCAAAGAAVATSSSCCRSASRSNGEPGIHAMAGDTDGVDGQEEIAGAVLTPDTLARAWAQGVEAARAPRRQRRPWLLRGARRLGGDRPDADQRERLQRHRDRWPLATETP